MSFDVTGMDDGWRKIVDDPAAPKTGYCLLANQSKTIAWESHDGVGFKMPLDEPAVWWKPADGAPIV